MRRTRRPSRLPSRLVAVLAVAAAPLVALAPAAGAGAAAPAAPAAVPGPGLRAGVAVVDGTWHVGAAAGQYGTENVPDSETVDREWDPSRQSTLKEPSYGIASRLSYRALVVEGADGTRIALVKNDNYLAQDLLQRRVAQLLAGGTSGITFDHIMLSASHDHSAPYYSTLAAGVFVFQDVFDARMFEYSARVMAEAINRAAADLRPATMGATTVTFPDFQENIVGPALGDDGSPAGYPRSHNDTGLVVARFDDVSDPARPKPLATWINYAQHPESLDGYDLISADYLAPLQRYVDRETGAPLVFTQGAVGSSEGPYDRGTPPTLPDGTIKAFAHAGYAQAERGARLLADATLEGWRAVGANDPAQPVAVPASRNVPVGMITNFVPGPASHPYPSVSNCRSESTVSGNPGAPAAGLPDCARANPPPPVPQPIKDASKTFYDTLVAAGVPVPSNYDAPSGGVVEENIRIKLQVVRLGELLLASCSCEPQVDLVLNLESRADKVQGNIYDGFDYASTCAVASATSYSCQDPRNPMGPRLTVTKVAYDRMVAQVHNDAKGWEDLAYTEQASSEPADPKLIKGNFTKEELAPSLGYALPVGVGHTGDYQGYTVSYREYQNRESYRKALTAYGPHTADYMVTRLVRMAALLKGGPPLPQEPLFALAAADEARQAAVAVSFGQITAAAYDSYAAQLPDDAGPVAAVRQPRDLQRFGAATFAWRGGSNYVDPTLARVERRVDGGWVPYADGSGEVPVTLKVPPGGASLATSNTGTQEWVWVATFEAFDAFPRRTVPGGQVPSGDYRFVVDGQARSGRVTKPYRVESAPFTVSRWEGITPGDPRLEAGNAVSLAVADPQYPRSYTPDATNRFTNATDQAKPICRRCTFRPWGKTSPVASVLVLVVRDGVVQRRVPATLVDGRWVAPTALVAGERAFVARGGVLDSYGEINGLPTRAVGPDGSLVDAPLVDDPAAVVPEAPLAPLLPIAGLGVLLLAAWRVRRRRTA